MRYYSEIHVNLIWYQFRKRWFTPCDFQTFRLFSHDFFFPIRVFSFITILCVFFVISSKNQFDYLIRTILCLLRVFSPFDFNISFRFCLRSVRILIFRFRSNFVPFCLILLDSSFHLSSFKDFAYKSWVKSLISQFVHFFMPKHNTSNRSLSDSIAEASSPYFLHPSDNSGVNLVT